MAISLYVTPLTIALAIMALTLCLATLIAVRLRRKKDADDAAFEDASNPLLEPPGPKGLPIIGASYIVGKYPKAWDAFSDLRKQYGDVYRLSLGSRQCVVVSSVTGLREVLVTKAQDFANRPDFLRFHAIFRGDRNLSIALCDWSEKQKLRRELAFAYMHPRMATMGCERMNEFITAELEDLVRDLSKHQNQVIEPRNHLLSTTASIFYQYLCSKRFSKDDPTFRKVVDVYNVVFHELLQGFAIDFMPWLKPFYKSRLDNLKSLAESVSQVTNPIFQEHEKTIDYENPRDLVDIFLAYLAQNKEEREGNLTKEDAEVIVEDLIGGHSVIANMWLWGLYLLSGSPEVQKNIRREVNAVTAGLRAPSLTDKPSMPYTEATVLEILRVISSPIIPHIATENTNIQGYRVDKGTMVMFNICDINMDPQLWVDPRTFNPQRFINEEGRITKPSYFIPFSIGKRTCMGDGLVKAIMFLGMATLIQRFDIVLPEGAESPDLYKIPGQIIATEEFKLAFRPASETTTSRNV